MAVLSELDVGRIRVEFNKKQQENGKLETQELKANDVAVGDEKFFSVSYNQCSIQRITTDEEHQQELD